MRWIFQVISEHFKVKICYLHQNVYITSYYHITPDLEFLNFSVIWELCFLQTVSCQNIQYRHKPNPILSFIWKYFISTFRKQSSLRMNSFVSCLTSYNTSKPLLHLPRLVTETTKSIYFGLELHGLWDWSLAIAWGFWVSCLNRFMGFKKICHELLIWSTFVWVFVTVQG